MAKPTVKIHSSVSLKGCGAYDPVLSFHDTPDGFCIFMDGVSVVFDSFHVAEEFFLRMSLRLKDWNEEIQWQGPTSDG
jgi:hypothetical protein